MKRGLKDVETHVFLCKCNISLDEKRIESLNLSFILFWSLRFGSMKRGLKAKPVLASVRDYFTLKTTCLTCSFSEIYYIPAPRSTFVLFFDYNPIISGRSLVTTRFPFSSFLFFFVSSLSLSTTPNEVSE